MTTAHPESRVAELVKVCFALPHEDDWPPVGSERLWAEPLGENRYRVDNTPWFATNLSADDVVEALAGDDGVLWATKRVEFSGRLTVRVIPLSESTTLAAIMATFAEFGVTGEGAGPAFRLVALDIPADADHAAILATLRAGQANGTWSYEEGCVTDAWLAL
ncbi:MAG TPA: DUF4265 domain-containing protein [Actinocatenispora sp.]